MENIVEFPGANLPNLAGPIRQGCSVIVDERHIPKMHMYDHGETIAFILDERLGFEFPKEWAYLAASFAANAMAIGAGYPCVSAETKDRPFAPKCFGIDFPDPAA